MTALENASKLLAELNQRHVQYELHIVRDALMVSVAVPGEYWEIEFFDDGHVELERFESQGVEEAHDVATRLLSHFDD